MKVQVHQNTSQREKRQTATYEPLRIHFYYDDTVNTMYVSYFPNEFPSLQSMWSPQVNMQPSLLSTHCTVTVFSFHPPKYTSLSSECEDQCFKAHLG